jgi:NAD(P)-dependent dehydrogenase (short-subunit alcohol dehydrogenase family)
MTSTPTLAGRKMLVVGASMGIGRAVAVGAVRAGAEVVLVARRGDALKEAVAQAGGGSVVEADLRSPEDCARIGEEARRLLGTVDLVVLAAGTALMRPLRELSAAEWAGMLETNLTGINLTISAMIPTLAPGAIVAALSSESVGHPFYWLAGYTSSKAALEESLRGWRVEHPEARFTCIQVGATVPTDFGSNFEPERLEVALQAWARQGRAQATIMNTDEVASVILGILASASPYPGVGLEHIVLRSPAPVIDSADVMIEAAASRLDAGS